MRTDLAASLIHNPKILFLDEPTIGLDVLVKDKVIKAIREIHKKYNTTIVLTTHNMDDILDLCNRVIILDEGSILYDGLIKNLKSKFGDLRQVNFSSKNIENLEEFILDIKGKCDIKEVNGYYNISFNNEVISINDVLSKVFKYFNVENINVNEDSLESIVKKIYDTKKI